MKSVGCELVRARHVCRLCAMLSPANCDTVWLGFLGDAKFQGHRNRTDPHYLSFSIIIYHHLYIIICISSSVYHHLYIIIYILRLSNNSPTLPGVALPWPGLCCLRIHRQEIHQLRSTQALRCQDVLQGATFLRDCGLVPGQVKLVKMLYIMIYIYIYI